MQIEASPQTFLPTSTRAARSLVRTITPEGMSLEPEKTEEEERLESSTLTFQKELTPEEENRVLFLKNMLAQLLTMGNGQPTEQQKARIREIEKELEKITGMKMQSSLADATSKMPGAKDEEEEEEKTQRQTVGIDPKETVHNVSPEHSKYPNPGMQMLQRNAFFAQLGTQLELGADLQVNPNS